MVYDHTVLSCADDSVIHLADTDPADVLVIIDRTDQHLGTRVRISFRRRDIVDDSLEKGFHAGAGTSQIQSRDSGFGRCKYEGTVDLFVACSQIHQKLQDLIDHLGRPGAGAVDFIDADDHGQIQGHGLGQDKACLGHRSLKGVYHQDHAVDHL